MSRSSSSRERHERGLAEPSVALAAVLALSLGVSAYALVLDGVATGGSGPAAAPVLERVHGTVTVGGVVDPGRVSTLETNTLADGGSVNVTLSVAGRQWTAGPTPPAPRTDGTDPGVATSTDRATAARRVGVALAPGRVRPGELCVRVWR